MKTQLLRPGENPLEMPRPRSNIQLRNFLIFGGGVLALAALAFVLFNFVIPGFYQRAAPAAAPTASPTLTPFPSETPFLIHTPLTPLAARGSVASTPTPTLTPKTRFITVPAEVTRVRTVVVTKVVSGGTIRQTVVVKQTVLVVITATQQATQTPTATPSPSPTPTQRMQPTLLYRTPSATPTLNFTPSFWIFLPVVGFNAPAIDTPILPPPSSEPGPTETPGSEPVEWPAATGTPVPSEPTPYP